MLGLKLNHVSKSGHRQQGITWDNVDPGLSHMESLRHNEVTKPVIPSPQVSENGQVPYTKFQYLEAYQIKFIHVCLVNTVND